MKTIGLCMIVKNESDVILRCLESVRPIVDYVLVEDTGSSDGTQAIIREWLDRVGLPGAIHDEPWQDCAYNRSHALARLRNQEPIDYALVLDADDYIAFEPGFDVAAFKNSLSQDVYDVELRQGSIRNRCKRICNNKLKFKFRGVLYPFLDTADQIVSFGITRGFYILSKREGARIRDPDKYRNNAKLLEQLLQTEKDKFLHSRYTFYLARNYRDAGDSEKALSYFMERAKLGYSTEEVFVSLYSAAQIQEQRGRPFEEVIATYLRASDVAPSRAEALHAASRLCRANNKFAEGYEFARRGLAIPLPAGGLFVEPWRYEYGLLDEFAVHAYWTERYQDCLEACQRLLREGKMPPDMHDRVKKNAEFAAEKIRLQGGSSRATVEHADKFDTSVAQRSERPSVPENAISGELQKYPDFSDWASAGRMPSCKTIGIVVPYRNREEHLRRFIPHMISYFRRELINHNVRPLILVSEQADNRKFNRGFVKNVGFLALEPYCDYVCFHDVDYLPMWADYRETEMPTRIVWWGMHVRPIRLTPGSRRVVAPRTGLGTVAIFKKTQFRLVNGYSNLYEGWGFEDTDLLYRCTFHGLNPQQKDGTFIPLDHDQEGFDDTGGKSAAWIENEGRYEAAKLRYIAEGAIQEGLTSVTIASLSAEVQEWCGLDDSEKLRIGHLKAAQIE